MKFFQILKARLRSPWGFMRIFRLGLGGVLLFDGWHKNELLPALLGAILVLQAVYNAGCCGMRGCDIDHPENKQRSSEAGAQDITFEEIN